MKPSCKYSSASPPVDSMRAMMIVWRIRGKIIRSVLCCVAHTYEQSLKFSVGLGVDAAVCQITLTICYGRPME